jgi:hypothetical protein
VEKLENTEETSERPEDALTISPLPQRPLRRQKALSWNEKSVASTSGLEGSPRDTVAPTSENEVGQRSGFQNLPPQSLAQTPFGTYNNGTQTTIATLIEAHKSTNAVSIVEDGSVSVHAPIHSLVDSKPKKILHFNPKTGTIGSPPAKKTVASVESINKTRSHGSSKQSKSKLVTLHYGHGEASATAIGLQIDQILKGTKRVASSPKKKAPVASKTTEPSKVDLSKSNKPVRVSPDKPSAVLHPFFSGKPAVKPKPSNPKETGKSDVTASDLER